MANISMDIIKELRERTGIGIMDCKKALQETDGDMDKAIRLLKEKGAITAAKKNERTVKEGSIGFCINDDKTQVACIELQCETDFVAKNELFINLAKDISKTAMNLNDISVDALLNSKSEKGETIQAMINEGIQKWGEKTVLADVKVMKTSGFFGTYVHFNNKLVSVVEFDIKPKGKCLEIANQIAMHVASEKPLALNREGIDTEAVKEQKEIFEKQIREQGKPENMIEKILEGKMNSWYSESVLIDQKLFTDNKITIKSLIDEISKESGSTATIKNFSIISLGL
ncbi:translation elongation factor Ts [Brachyspira aalborgi]|jgi:elongation factor Ts|uniref:Elongation factor Ts n=1 Tax=Brachyspira aalborgi TaxID=29522 RepID=A0AB38PZI5_9SPIR|nr:translation elongation factor Ts [Brachyspira aalborgi]CCY75085.1 elongation factor Ts [Brachyspira sp. CAG:700]TXJ16187.1 translation elongation factor Ts [Brachyspira aalborgi]TXJ21818.1 translation elongation factor Ts [Brachyspira aalborgi]TXJ26483.1 translation elongation factor Ts [Brachyspira aalborgi]TXJ33314.1 translation elongation factor Ts [Brachyspira aalborgi]